MKMKAIVALSVALIDSPPPSHIKYHNQSTQFYHLTTHSCELIR